MRSQQRQRDKTKHNYEIVKQDLLVRSMGVRWSPCCSITER